MYQFIRPIPMAKIQRALLKNGPMHALCAFSYVSAKWIIPISMNTTCIIAECLQWKCEQSILNMQIVYIQKEIEKKLRMLPNTADI